MKTHLRKRKLIIRLSAVLCLLVVIALLVLSFFASLYRTIPATIPFFSSLPRYKNAWMYTAPTRLRQPKPEVLSAAYISFIDSTRHHVSQLRWTMRNIEDVFNKAHDYPYIIFSTEPLTTEYKELIASVTKADVSFQVLGKEYYGYTNTTDQYTAYLTRQKLAYTLYGDSEPFRFKSRLMAGTLYK
jgi:alpha 1,2-mannosyltransferase